MQYVVEQDTCSGKKIVAYLEFSEYPDGSGALTVSGWAADGFAIRDVPTLAAVKALGGAAFGFDEPVRVVRPQPAGFVRPLPLPPVTPLPPVRPSNPVGTGVMQIKGYVSGHANQLEVVALPADVAIGRVFYWLDLDGLKVARQITGVELLAPPDAEGRVSIKLTLDHDVPQEDILPPKRIRTDVRTLPETRRPELIGD